MGPDMDELEGLLKDAVARFNDKAATDEKVKKELAGMEKRVLVDVADGGDGGGARQFHFFIRNGMADGFAAGAVDIGEKDVRIVSDTVTLVGLLKKEMGPMSAMARGRLKVKAPLEDLIRLRKFF